MTVLLDATVQHAGWSGGTFANGGWGDHLPFTVTGLQARSYWCQSLNGQQLDQAASFGAFDGQADAHYWFNTHTAAVLSGTTNPSPFPVAAGDHITTFTRVPRSSDVILWRIIVTDQATTPPPTTPPCQYGTQAQSGFPSGVFITAPLIDQVLAPLGLEVLAPAFGVLVGTTVALTELCGSQPPVFPSLNADFTRNSPALLLQAFQSVSWPYFCQCVPGSPAPIDFPPPTVVLPPSWPTAPSFPCDPANLCASIARIETLLNAVAGTLGSNYALTTLLQRYSLPFGVVPGLFHIGLTGEGSVFVSRLVGLEYDVKTKPVGARISAGVTPYNRDLGWIGFTLPSGAVIEHRVTRDHELWLPDEAQLATQVGWSLTPGTSIDVRELAAET